MSNAAVQVILTGLTGTSSLFCPLILDDGPTTAKGALWEDLATTSADCASDVILSFSGFGYRGDDVGRGNKGQILSLATFSSVSLSRSSHFTNKDEDRHLTLFFFCSSRMCSVTLSTISSILNPESEFLVLFRTFLTKAASSVLKEKSKG